MPALALAAPQGMLRSDIPAPIETLAFVDVETSGLNPARHEILEVAVVRVDARSLEVLAEYESLVAPERIEDAQPEALAVCGYSEAAWRKAKPLREALLDVAPLLEGALIAGHNVDFDWAFLEIGYRRAGLVLPRVDYHRLDTASLGWPLLQDGGAASLSLDSLAEQFGLNRPRPHRALADARFALEIAKRLRERLRLGARIMSLVGDNHEALNALLAKLEQSSNERGPWHANANPEAAAPSPVYVCHLFADNPEGNEALR